MKSADNWFTSATYTVITNKGDTGTHDTISNNPEA